MKTASASKTVVFWLAAACAIPAQAQRSCYNGVLSGDYSFRITGQILTGPLIGPNNGVALVTFDGDGKLIARDHVAINGIQPLDEWRDSTGTYTVNPDCTGKAQVNFIDGRPPIVYYFVFLRSRQQLDIVVGNTGTNVSVVATRM